jgi:hypothetical protein
MAFLYKAEEHEYEEGFGPSVTVRVGNDETTWKRSRNKWNPFEKIKTLPGADSANDFKVIWDRAHVNSFYVTERMYYYLDRDKHRDKFRNLRAKLYITRLQQRAGQTFLLQFIMDKIAEEEPEQVKVRENLRPMKLPNRPPPPTTAPPPLPSHLETHSPRSLAMLNALKQTQLSASPPQQPQKFYPSGYGAQAPPPIHPALIDHFGSNRLDSTRIQSFPPMFAAPRFYSGIMTSPSGTLGLGTLNPLLGSSASSASSQLQSSAASQNLLLRSLGMAGSSDEATASQLTQFQLAQQVQLQQLLAQQAAASLELQQREALILQQLREQQMYASSMPHLSGLYSRPELQGHLPHHKSRSLDPGLTSAWRNPETSSGKRQFDPTGSDLAESATKRRSTEMMTDNSGQHAYAPGLNLAALLDISASEHASSSSVPSTPTTASSSSTTERMSVDPSV